MSERAAWDGQATATARLCVEGMHCASCVAKVERELAQVPGVEDALANLATTEATVRYRPDAAGVADLERT